jgi:hypothetical protein
MIDNWSDEFIPSELRDNIIRLDEPDHHERDGYTVCLAQGNYENNLHAAQNESFHSNDCGLFLTGSVSTDINGERQNPDIRMLHTLLDVVGDRTHPSEQHLERMYPALTRPRAGAANSPTGRCYRRKQGAVGFYCIWDNGVLESRYCSLFEFSSCIGFNKKGCQ